MEERSPNSEPDGSRTARALRQRYRRAGHATNLSLTLTRRFRSEGRRTYADWITGNREARPGLH